MRRILWLKMVVQQALKLILAQACVNTVRLGKVKDKVILKEANLQHGRHGIVCFVAGCVCVWVIAANVFLTTTPCA